MTAPRSASEDVHVCPSPDARGARAREIEVLEDGLLVTLSHELQTPLTSIVLSLDLIRDEGALSHRQNEALEVIDRNARRLQDLVSDLLLFAGLESGGVTLERGRLDLADVVRHSVDAIRARAAARDIDVDLLAEPVHVDGDARRIAQVVDNLLTNAVKFTAPGGRVRVRVGVEDGRAFVEVDDNGIGIPAADLPGIFERFTRAGNATRGAVPGAGLGLAIVKRLAELHGGAVSVQSTEGAGASFRVALPLGEGDDR